MRQNWVGKIENLVITKSDAKTDWVVARIANSSLNAPRWFALELSHRTPTSMAMFNLLRDAARSDEPVRLAVDRDVDASPDWQEAVVIAVESPRLPGDAPHDEF
jgi:hypothetical protein